MGQFRSCGTAEARKVSQWRDASGPSSPKNHSCTGEHDNLRESNQLFAAGEESSTRETGSCIIRKRAGMHCNRFSMNKIIFRLQKKMSATMQSKMAMLANPKNIAKRDIFKISPMNSRTHANPTGTNTFIMLIIA